MEKAPGEHKQPAPVVGEWKLHLNAAKCKVMDVGLNNPGYMYKMKQNHGIVDIGTTELGKDLGVNIDHDLNFCNILRSK